MEAFNDVFLDCTSQGTKIPKNQYLPEGKNIIIDQGQNIVAGYTDLEDGLYEDVPAIIFGDHTRIIKYVDKPFFLGADGVKLLKSRKKDANYKYLYYALKNAKIPDTGYNRHYKWLKEVEIEYPDSARQTEIVTILDCLTRVIEHKKTELAKLKDLVKSRFVELFGDKQFPRASIGELVSSIPRAKSVFRGSDVIKYIDISSIDNVNNEITNFTECTFSEAPSRAQQHLSKGDILISTVRPNLKNVAMVRWDSDNLVGSSGFCVLRVVKASPEYLMTVVCSNVFTEAMIRATTGANYPAIKDVDVLDYMVDLPPSSLQNEFSRFVKQSNKSKLAIQQSLEKLEILRKSLMQHYFG